MLRTPRSAWLASLALALVGGYFVTGYFFYRAPIGLDSSAFPVGEAIQTAIGWFAPGLRHDMAGWVWVLGTLLVVWGVAEIVNEEARARAAAGPRHMTGFRPPRRR